MTDSIERDLGPQPIAAIMSELNITTGDVVGASQDNITYKMLSRACKGRRLTVHVQEKVRKAVSAAASKDFAMNELFTY